MSTTFALPTIERSTILRERVFPLARILEVLEILRDEKATGTIMIDLCSGGISNIRIREEKKL